LRVKNALWRCRHPSPTAIGISVPMIGPDPQTRSDKHNLCFICR
jgi:hypothetical protein